MTFTNYDLARMVEEARAERDRLMRERNRFHEALDWVLHYEDANPEDMLAAIKDKARSALERPL